MRVLLGICDSDSNPCITYVVGAADAWTAAAASLGRPPLFCFPAGTSNLQITQSAVQYLRARPQESDTNAASVLLGAFTTIYPCPR
ncbi:MAG TPA: Rap1a/Tai family immunity protein [Allosphingosinicella sp.]|nr:Rap1a/Tai family immunity protein [Allosphingosinicella sp.]